MALKDYVPVMVRLKQFLEENKDKKVLISTTPTVSWEKEAVYFRAEIIINGEVKAIGHALAPSVGEDKEFEKAETTAVGRALAFLGYGAEDAPEQDEEEEAEEKPARRGLGSKRKAEKVEEKEEEEDSEDDDSEEEDEKDSDGDDDEEDSEEDDEDEAEEKEEKKPATKSESRLKGVMAKYGMKK